jgi:3-dehydroshikimate dehydratase
MFYTGVTSVTFRKLDVSDIIQLAVESELDGIEWGGDIHVPPSDLKNAKRVGASTRKADLKVLSYGSYYTLSEIDPRQDFMPVLETTEILGAPLIRVWCGNRSPDKADDSYYEKIIENGKIMGEMCAKKGIKAAFEYHRNSLTQDSESACRVLKGINHPFIYTGWQPNPQIDHADNLRQLQQVKPWLANIHVFHWKSNQRFLLKDGVDEWTDYLNVIDSENHAFILEFVKNDSIEAFIEDAEMLKEMVQEKQKLQTQMFNL